MMQALPPPDLQPAIVVTGTALPEAVGERVLQVERLRRDELETAGTQPFDRLLSRFSGAEQFRRSDSRSAHPTSQGLTLRGLGGNAASRALVILDGVPQADPFGGWIAWPSIATSGIGEVRLLRGGGSVAAGPGALGGILELSSASSPLTAAVVEVGSRQSAAVEAVTGTQTRSGMVTLTFSGSRGDGFIPIRSDQRGPADRAAPYRTGAARLRWVVPVGPEQELQASLLTFADDRERGLAFTANRTRGSDLSLRLVSRGDLPWTALVYAQGRDFDSSFAGVDEGRTEARRTSLQFDVPASAIGWSAEARPTLWNGLDVRFGTDGRRASGRSLELASYVAGAATRIREAGGQSSRAGLFAELTMRAGPLTATMAGRMDRWRIFGGRLSERAIATGSALIDQRFDSRSGWRPTGRLGLAAQVTERLTLRSAAYAGWREPTLNELFRPFRAGADATAANAALRPERLRGLEVGADWRSGDWTGSVTAFSNRLEDAIANVSLGLGPGSFERVGFVGAGGAYRQRQNLTAIRSRGLEASGRWEHGPWTVSTSLSAYDPRVSARGAARPLDGLRPAQSPRFSASARGSWNDRGREAEIVVNYEGARFEDDLNRQQLPGAATVDAFAAWPVGGSLTLSGRAENLLNARLVSTVSAAGVEELATPRTLWVGLKYRPARR